jgi:desulfoferrodoxin (superoxide reductase-like protein)
MRMLIVTLVLLAVPLLAHSPKSLELDYNSETSVLNISVTHSVNDASKHYVNKVVVELNGKKIIEQKFRSQTDEEGQQMVYSIIDAREGDKISVSAFCNISGKKKGELTVTAPEGDEGTQ